MSMEDALKVREMQNVHININTKLPLYPYQKVGALFMYIVKKCFVLDDPGLGKTPESLGFVKLLQKQENISCPKVLVVTTSGTIYQWYDETKKFTNLIPVVVDGGTKRREKIFKEFKINAQNILIMNYSKINFDNYTSSTIYFLDYS